MYMYGELACDPCLQKFFKADRKSWADAQEKIHLPALREVKSGPDLHQCFCGYWAFRKDYFEEHLRDNPYDEKAVADLSGRLLRLDVHERCKERVLDAMRGKEIVKKAHL
ncbi:Hypothetical protein D9617_14g075490 [Elsinoe fawcettii]|nr:Hypothetical protein D9617_14g075490 [Elsinoe fawcettii]